jgi:hypothetical protein
VSAIFQGKRKKKERKTKGQGERKINKFISNKKL